MLDPQNHCHDSLDVLDCFEPASREREKKTMVRKVALRKHGGIDKICLRSALFDR
jgi:hypothetical protein